MARILTRLIPETRPGYLLTSHGSPDTGAGYWAAPSLTGPGYRIPGAGLRNRHIGPAALLVLSARYTFSSAAASRRGRRAERQGWMSVAVTGEVSSPGVREVELSVRGMTCAACAAR